MRPLLLWFPCRNGLPPDHQYKAKALAQIFNDISMGVRVTSAIELFDFISIAQAPAFEYKSVSLIPEKKLPRHLYSHVHHLESGLLTKKETC